MLARHLRHMGVRPEVTVAVFLERGFDAIVAFLGILKAGGIYVPVDPSYPEARIAHLLSDCRPAVIVTTGALEPHLSGGSRQIFRIDEDWAARAASYPPVENLSSPDCTAYIIYTSGSTGTPKGVQIQHRSLVNMLRWMQRDFPLNTETGSARSIRSALMSRCGRLWDPWQTERNS